MHRDCIAAVNKALGRALTQEEQDGLERQLREHLRGLAAADPKAYQSMTPAQRLQEAAKRAEQTHLAEAAKKRQRAALAVTARASLDERFSTLRSAGASGAKSVAQMLTETDIYVKGIGRQYFSGLLDTIAAAEPKFFGLIEDARGVRDFIREVLEPGSTGNKIAEQGAKAWTETTESMRTRFNGAGGDVGKLNYGYLPQAHDSGRIRLAGVDQWVADTLPTLDRGRYLNTDGTLMDDAAVTTLLREAWDTLQSDGLSKLEPGKPTGTGMRANKRSDHRVIHFADADAYLAYQQRYGKGSVFTAMQAHVGGLARDIGLVERWGPNPELMWTALHDMARKADNGTKYVGPLFVSPQGMWEVLAGHAGQVDHQRLAEIAQGIRNVEVFGKLQGATISAITDFPSLLITAGYNRLPIWQTVKNTIAAFGGDTKEYAGRAGLVADSVISDMNRWAESNLKDGWTGHLANATMKFSLMNAWTDAIRRGFSVTMMGGLGKMTRSDWSALDATDRAHMTAKGVTETDFAVWKAATPENWRGQTMLTPEAINAIPDSALESMGDPARLRNTAISRLLGVIVDESEFAAVAPDLYSRAALTRGTQRGTVEGEFLRSLMLFKGFPFAVISRHWNRAFSGDMTAASRTAYIGAMIVGTTTFGALALQLKDMLAGKDPRPMDNPKFWTAAMAQGGGLGFAGDLIYQAGGGLRSQAGVSTSANLMSSVAGPVFGAVAEFGDLTVGNAFQAAKGEETHFGAEALRLARSHTPFVNLWYARAVIDHAALNHVQELLSPGYLDRMQSRVRRDWGNDFWWEPDEFLPERAPDLTNAIQ